MCARVHVRKGTDIMFIGFRSVVFFVCQSVIRAFYVFPYISAD